MTRLFTAIEIPPEVSLDLTFMQGGIEGARWIDRQNHHLTLRFIGEVDGRLELEIRSALNALRSKPFEVTLKGIGRFGTRRPRALWAGVEANRHLVDLQLSHERLCQTLGLPPETRNFMPHVTLARLRDTRLNDVECYMQSHSLYRSQPFPVNRIVLYSSKPSRGGGPYAVEAVCPLGLESGDSL